MVVSAKSVTHKHHTPKIDPHNVFIRDRNSAVSDVLFLSIGEGALVIDEQGKISRINNIGLDILGYKAEDLLGKWYPDTLRAEDVDGKVIQNIDSPVMEVFLSGKPVFKKVYYRRKDGSRVPVALTVSPVMLDDKPLGAIQLFRDITEELQLEHAKDEFISIASHQLRTPATVVKQYLGLIIDGYVDSPDKQMAMLKLAYDHNDNQLEIINNLLKIARVEANKIIAVRKETDLIKLLSKVIDSQKPSYEKRGMNLKLISQKSTVVCSIDPLHIQMVFENLINNAIKYSPDNSTITIEVADSASEITIHVRDKGIGIAAKDMPKLFKKFSRVEDISSTASGTGLGLYWAKKLIDLHNGKISLQSALGAGTTITVGLPRKIQV